MPEIRKTAASQLSALRRQNAALTRGQLRRDVDVLIRDMLEVDGKAKKAANRLAGVLNKAFGLLYHPDSGFRLNVEHVVTSADVKYFLSEDRSKCDQQSRADVPPLHKLVDQERFLSHVRHVDHEGSFRLRYGGGLAFKDLTNRSGLMLELESPYQLR